MNPLKNRFNSVRGRLAFLAGALTCASLGAALALVLSAYHQENEAVSRQLLSTARALQVGVDVHLRQHMRMLQVLAKAPELERGDLAGFEQRLRGLALPTNLWLSLADSQGRQFINTRLKPGESIPSFVVEEELASALKRGETYISNFRIGALKRPILFIAMPADRGTKILGVAYDPESFSDNLSLRRMVGENLISIVDRTGVIAARSRNPEKHVGQSATPAFWKVATASKEGVVESVTLDGTRVLSAFVRSELAGWTIIHAAPQSEAYASIRRLLLIAGVLSAVLLGVSLWLARWIGLGLVTAVNKLVGLATEIGRGVLPKQPQTGLAEADLVASALHTAGGRLISHERELRELNQSLEHRISSRTHQLIAANQELAVTNRELADFARVAAHDLREPLRTISGFSSSLVEDFSGQLPPVARNYTERISAAAQRMQRLLESIFAYTRVSHSPRVTEAVDLNQTARDVRDDLEMRLKETGGEMQWTTLPTVWGDPRELHQMLLNLVANGLKFHRRSVPPVVQVEASESSEGVHLIVSDNGIGFDPNLAERLFVPFQRLENANGYEGTGMGLALVRRVAERHHGTVRVFSTPGAGSRFEVILKRTTNEEIPEGASQGKS
jgi:signal transduction histidine kinase